MTKKRLEQYRDLKREIRQLEEQYYELVSRKSRMTSDSVSGSMSEYPYIQQVVKIHGLDVVDQARADRMKACALERRRQAEREVEEIDRWISSIQDSRMRQVIYLKFIRGMTWTQVASKVGGGNNEDSVRMAFSRFINRS